MHLFMLLLALLHYINPVDVVPLNELPSSANLTHMTVFNASEHK